MGTFTDQELRAVLTQGEVAAVYRRNRGGTSADGGFSFQRRYALLRLVQLATTSPSAVVSVEEICPVDDVTVTGATVDEFAQCKTSPDETWTGRRSKVAEEFRQQKRLADVRYATAGAYRLTLVVPKAKRRKLLADKVPVDLQGCVEVVHFQPPVVAHHAWEAPETSKALDALLPLAFRTAGGREALYKQINHAAGEPWQPQDPGTMLPAMATKVPDLPIALPHPLPCSASGPDVALAKAILAQIPGVSVLQDRGVWWYQAGHESGFLARHDTLRFARFVGDVIAQSPKTLEALLKVRP